MILFTLPHSCHMETKTNHPPALLLQEIVIKFKLKINIAFFCYKSTGWDFHSNQLRCFIASTPILVCICCVGACAKLCSSSATWSHCMHDQPSCEIVLLTHPSRNLRAAPLRPPRRRVARFESSSSEDIPGTTQGGHGGTSGSWRRRFPSSSSEVLVFTLCDEVVHWSTGWNWTFPALIQSKMVDG